MKNSVKTFLIVLVILAIVASTVYAISIKNKNSASTVEVNAAKVEKGDIVSLFSTTGVVESKSKQEYYILSPTKVLKVYVSVGDNVKKGDKLLELETQDLSIQYQIAQKQLEMAQMQLDALKKLKEKQSQQSQVAAQIPNTSLPQQLPSGESTVQQPSTSQIQTSSLSLDDQIKLQQKQVEIAELNLKNIKQNMYKQQKYVIAEFDGTVTIVNAKDNSYFTSSQFPAIAVEDLNNLQIALDVNPYDAVNLKEGQKAYIHFADKTFEGVVSKVSPTATKVITQTGGDNVVKVYVDLLNNDGTIKPGFNVDVDIKIGEKKDTIKVPSEAIVSDKNGNEFVYVVENGIAKQKKVKTGLASDLETEIISGVNVGEKVILNPTSSIEDGTKVSVKGGKD
ncbi:HlyD family secretion protein [Thermoanaerobacter thermohydrosulfuricus]|jgi:HlyD family secretion protein|uniref:RND family efflux transporter, MFP subunit n=2 Tax=Thermoanaerobacter thermohydrosulfuricus TaxID=1516 RepID=M8DJE7_THETY|nr:MULTISPECIES: efflux RND transporter periplasmic adaptor subunit [Thermoanaerobacter]EGD52212.1 efflux transporter, RND family, MFP subunit [Thermoanaerobacter ethanolicus JW 200]HHY81044.1 efflux RND transporter periplasmic adaptor subunit [Thermoanaerobacter sp.]EMT40222.1 RND family efflux transporter, MFP subunit [Thermoanaerobacter thermohydrosulfuricus WC1]SDE96795.1 HlyD family secretion protein [Thermoanaerobacter thermohydrosulfuricus]SFE23946.1 HlyD family secretion protein [Therm